MLRSRRPFDPLALLPMMCAAVLVATLLLRPAAGVRADRSWPRLPTAAEVEAARTQAIAAAIAEHFPGVSPSPASVARDYYRPAEADDPASMRIVLVLTLATDERAVGLIEELRVREGGVWQFEPDVVVRTVPPYAPPKTDDLFALLTASLPGVVEGRPSLSPSTPAQDAPTVPAETPAPAATPAAAPVSQPLPTACAPYRVALAALMSDFDSGARTLPAALDRFTTDPTDQSAADAVGAAVRLMREASTRFIDATSPDNVPRALTTQHNAVLLALQAESGVLAALAALDNAVARGDADAARDEAGRLMGERFGALGTAAEALIAQLDVVCPLPAGP